MAEPDTNSKRIFLCHSKGDKTAVGELYRRLRVDGLHPWLDEEDLIPGQVWQEEITRAVRASAVVLVVLSKASIAKFGFVHKEIKFALDVADAQPEGKIFIIPARLEECDVPERLGHLHWVNLFEPGGYEKLLRALRVAGVLSSAVAPVSREPAVLLVDFVPGMPEGAPPGILEGQTFNKTTTPPSGMIEQHGQALVGADGPNTPATTWMFATAFSRWLLLGLLVVASFVAWRFYSRSAADPAVNTEISPTKEAGRLPISTQPKVNPKDGLAYVPIPAGSFEMGCSPGDQECDKTDELLRHTVEITKGFLLGRTEVTQEAFEKVMPVKNPSYFKGSNLPVEEVTWDEAKQYCALIGGRLPTEAEWEYAARGGGSAARYGNIDDVAWYSKNSGGKTHAVGGLKANGFGLFDMLGNVWEWTNDWYAADYYKQSVKTDPSGPATGTFRGLRGGGWSNDPVDLRASGRGRSGPGNRGDGIGLRCVWE